MLFILRHFLFLSDSKIQRFFIGRICCVFVLQRENGCLLSTTNAAYVRTCLMPNGNGVAPSPDGLSTMGDPQKSGFFLWKARKEREGTEAKQRGNMSHVWTCCVFKNKYFEMDEMQTNVSCSRKDFVCSLKDSLSCWTICPSSVSSLLTLQYNNLIGF